MKTNNRQKKWQKIMHQIIFKSDTFYGKLFDELLLVLIVISIIVVMLESIEEFRILYGQNLFRIEWLFTIVFSIEYVLRIISSPKPWKYIFSFLGIIDFMALIPTYIAIVIPEAQPFIVIRGIRLLRIYRILKLYRYIRAGNILMLALRNSSQKIMIFMMFLLVLVIMLGSIMYVIEDASNGFFSIPLSIYWAVITLTTVGYGDIVPVTGLGKFIATFIMLLGYSIIAIPTGIVSAELVRTRNDNFTESSECKKCGEQFHEPDAMFCKKCGERL